MGVVLGIASVIGVVTLGAGLQESILGSITGEFDADLVALGLERQDAMNGPPTSPDVYAFTDRDVDRLAALEGVAAAGATVPVGGMEVLVGDEPLRGLRVTAARGDTFAKYDAGRGIEAPGEVVVSNLTAQRLVQRLGTADLLGTGLVLRYAGDDGKVASDAVTIVGVEKASGFFAAETITVPAKYAPDTPVDGRPTTAWQSVVLKAASPDAVGAVEDRARTYLEGESDARNLKGETLRFRYDTQAEVADMIAAGVGQFTAFIGAIGGVALLVGMVGIANIMLVSVKERTREIGVMKATGASSRDVLLVFLVEAVAICVVGAVFGIALGSLMGMGLGAMVTAISQGADPVPFVPVFEWYAIAVFLGVGVGLLSGLYPARRAANVSPVEALRYE